MFFLDALGLAWEMGSIQLRGCGGLAERREAATAIDDSVSPRLTTWVEPPDAVGLLPPPLGRARVDVLLPESLGVVAAGASVGAAAAGACWAPRLMAPSRAPPPELGAATG